MWAKTMVAAPWSAVETARRDARQVDLSWIQPPPRDGWTLAADALQFLAALVRQTQPQHLLEFGSALSTRVLAWACAQHSPATRISSVDHDPEFGAAAAANFARLVGELNQAAFQIAPVVLRDCGGQLLPTYALDPQRFASTEPVDLALIDGPPSELGGREGTLYQVMNVLRPGGLAVLDDAARAAERASLQHWQDNLGNSVEVRSLPGFGRGLAVIHVPRPVPRAQLVAHRQRLTRQDIEGLVAIDEQVVLVDQGWYGSAVVPHRHWLPFLERAGQYHGPPADSDEAIRELDRLHSAGAAWLVFAWPAFWWFECYADFLEHLRAHHECVRENNRLVAFRLEPNA